LTALTFESISTLFAFPACYRPIFPAGFAYQVILQTIHLVSDGRFLPGALVAKSKQTSN